MFSSVLSVLLLGMVPSWSDVPFPQPDVTHISVASPSPLQASLTDVLEAKKPLSASGVIIMDLQSAQVLYERHADAQRPMASLTKLMTALLITEHHSLDEWVTIPRSAGHLAEASVSLKVGDHFRVGDLLTAMLVSSSNQAAFSLAVFHSGTEAEFATLMNNRAASLGLTHTSFQNAVGFDDPHQWSTPRDIAHLAAFAFAKPELHDRMSLPADTIKSREGTVVALTQTHLLLKQESPVVAGKTGTTDAAGQCLMSIVKEGSREYIVVLLGSHQRYRDMQAVLSVLASLFA